MKLAQTLSPDNSEQILFLHKEHNSEVVVYANKENIWLTIDGVIQTAIERKAPYRPVLPHCFVMLLPLLHDTEPKRILELGAGALGLQRYLLFSHPNIKMESVESSQAIVKANQEYFPESQLMNVITQDAYQVISEKVNKGALFDWLIVDLFFGEASPFLHNTQAYVEQLNQLISDQGWLIINTLTKDTDELKRITELLKTQTNCKVYLFQVPDLQNHIFMCKKTIGDEFHFPQEIEKHNLANSIFEARQI